MTHDTATTDAPADETIFTWGAPPLKFGAGASDEVGFELSQHGVRRVLVLTDPGVLATGVPHRIAESFHPYGITYEIFDGVHVEPTDDSMAKAIGYATEQGPWDAFVAVGGGSTIDTAKAVNLLTTHPGELMDYVNKPVGRAQTPPGPLKPFIAVPTTAGTGSESTAMCVLDVLSLRVKTGISHWRLRPTLAVVDPLLTMSLPPEVTAASGMDIVCHALESYTARDYRTGPRKAPEDRVTYCGSNPVSDLWCERAMGLLAQSFRRAVRHGADDVAARTDMMMAATFAGMGFGNAGVHLPHANAYPVAGRVSGYHPSGYGVGGGPAPEAMVPHGQAVSLTAPAAFRFTFDAAPERHLRAAQLLSPQTETDDPVQRLPTALTQLMRDIDVPSGIGAVGFAESDVDDLVEGTMTQQRLLATCPKDVTEDVVARIFRESVENW
ncbi:hydroxyacid-oxoacid transhydrogenase [Rhodococcus aerolatus]